MRNSLLLVIAVLAACYFFAPQGLSLVILLVLVGGAIWLIGSVAPGGDWRNRGG